MTKSHQFHNAAGAAAEDAFRIAARALAREPKLVVVITYLTWTGDGLLRQAVFVGLRADKPASEVKKE